MQRYGITLSFVLLGCQQAEVPIEDPQRLLGNQDPLIQLEPRPDPEPEPDPVPVTALKFADAQTVTGIEDDRFVTHGDVDGDGNLDFVIARYNGRLSWLKGNGDGSFTNATPGWTSTGLQALVDKVDFCRNFQCSWNLSWVNTIELADFDGDGDDELLVSFTAQASSEYWTIVGTLDFDGQKSTATILGADNNYVSAEVIADIDDDKGAELILYTWHNSYLLRNGSPDRAEEFSSTGAGNYYPQSWTIDLNKDGLMDIVTFYNGGYGIYGVNAFIRGTDGSFTELMLDDEIFGYRAAGNGKHRRPATEVVLTTSEQVFWLEGGQTPNLFPVLDFGELQPWGSFYGDFNGSGSLDLLAPSMDGLIGLVGDGFGGFDAIETTHFEGNYNEQVADFNGDGLDDIYHVIWSPDFQEHQLNVILNISR